MADRDDILQHHAAGTLLPLIVERLRRRRADEMGKAFSATLARLHNEQAIDVLAPAAAIEASTISQHEFFGVMLAYCDLIPELDAEVPAMLAAVKALVARAGNDGAAGQPNGAYRSWAERGNRAQETLAAVDPKSPEDAAYVFVALQALAVREPHVALNQAIGYLGGSAAPARSAAAKAIGSMALANAEAQLLAVQALADASGSADDNTLGHILVSCCEIARRHSGMEAAAVDVLRAAGSRAEDNAIHQVSLELMSHAEQLSPAIVAELTKIAVRVTVANRGTLDNLDMASSSFIDSGRLGEALTLIEPLISTHDDLTSLEALNSFAHALIRLDPPRLANVIIRWLRSRDANLGRATLSLIAEHHGGPLVLDVDARPLDLSDAEVVLLARRTIGFLFVHPITAASLVLGLIRDASPAAISEMSEILFDPLLINFSGELADWLKERSTNSSDSTQPIVSELLARLETYIQGLRSAGRINELRPSERERMIERHRQQESSRQLHKEIEKKSVFMSLVSRSVLLYGNRSISYFEGPDGTKRRDEMKLHTISHSVEAPRLDILEPFDLDYTLRAFRVMRLPE